ncbi:hypothetical protein [Entomohabitans teleogrylli]|uniref:hypothetical protein n=1 Tax=Entomohabitans teleogrylli TaxID=1384589 RepID=UPI0012B6A1A1|nr:hypothetical protein [Entomohabitans teleogrylli]
MLKKSLPAAFIALCTLSFSASAMWQHPYAKAFSDTPAPVTSPVFSQQEHPSGGGSGRSGKKKIVCPWGTFMTKHITGVWYCQSYFG